MWNTILSTSGSRHILRIQTNVDEYSERTARIAKYQNYHEYAPTIRFLSISLPLVTYIVIVSRYAIHYCSSNESQRWDNCVPQDLPTLYFLRPLAEAMTSKDPADRPTIEEALEKFEKIIEELSEEDVRKEILPLPVPQPSIQTRLVKAVSSKTRTVAHRIREILGKYCGH